MCQPLFDVLNPVRLAFVRGLSNETSETLHASCCQILTEKRRSNPFLCMSHGAVFVSANLFKLDLDQDIAI